MIKNVNQGVITIIFKDHEIIDNLFHCVKSIERVCDNIFFTSIKSKLIFSAVDDEHFKIFYILNIDALHNKIEVTNPNKLDFSLVKSAANFRILLEKLIGDSAMEEIPFTIDTTTGMISVLTAMHRQNMKWRVMECPMELPGDLGKNYLLRIDYSLFEDMRIDGNGTIRFNRNTLKYTPQDEEKMHRILIHKLDESNCCVNEDKLLQLMKRYFKDESKISLTNVFSNLEYNKDFANFFSVVKSKKGKKVPGNDEYIYFNLIEWKMNKPGDFSKQCTYAFNTINSVISEEFICISNMKIVFSDVSTVLEQDELNGPESAKKQKHALMSDNPKDISSFHTLRTSTAMENSHQLNLNNNDNNNKPHCLGFSLLKDVKFENNSPQNKENANIPWKKNILEESELSTFKSEDIINLGDISSYPVQSLMNNNDKPKYPVLSSKGGNPIMDVKISTSNECGYMDPCRNQLGTIMVSSIEHKSDLRSLKNEQEFVECFSKKKINQLAQLKQGLSVGNCKQQAYKNPFAAITLNMNNANTEGVSKETLSTRNPFERK